ncbi:MAG: aminodeoxychorismate lyase [Acinetobacter johnsonii]|jgi:4-amino-4-deoxychorismate lyase|uniref:Aminodeoxychorismate lyase n=1 Tax=Acinetobacter johnsonii TaxID=40214 RepID=A0A2W5RR64_ACIJO|nr:aminodeoxychorismate lyase [Acinetobacter johnsonii]MDH0655460.1 aminodeoxychorismate lyase [Acinetobacter johnsonii]MDH0834400.1 aminodeoxychorismate lyase [Acinetobacter johnsonii]MDH0837550.1 aminodeoxychorismate lyase [Acinetobacter johnsonii]MDH2046178.1 aminodeoxychorismate lyase [Acinetobacter johnsonii]PZQ92951.1 MAG: aminodeoxychorismate lyase [Acinetobacter johnsonii]
MHCYKNAQEIKQIELLDRAFHYGDGCFSTARIREGVIELESLHIARLKLACERLLLSADLAFIQRSIVQLKQTYAHLNGTLKIIISRGEGQRGYSLPAHPADVWVFFYPQASEVLTYSEIDSGVLQHAMGLSMPQMVGVKSLNRLEQVLLKHEAEQHGWLEALVTDVQGSVVEGVSSNCFILLNDRWISPELRYNGVHGVMRAEILARMQQQGMSCELRMIDMEEIPRFQSLFFCNALSPMKIAKSLNHQHLDVQPCIDLFHRLQLNQMQ